MDNPQDDYLRKFNPKNDDVAAYRYRSDAGPEFRTGSRTLGESVQHANAPDYRVSKPIRRSNIVYRNMMADPLEVTKGNPAE